MNSNDLSRINVQKGFKITKIIPYGKVRNYKKILSTKVKQHRRFLAIMKKLFVVSNLNNVNVDDNDVIITYSEKFNIYDAKYNFAINVLSKEHITAKLPLLKCYSDDVDDSNQYQKVEIAYHMNEIDDIIIQIESTKCSYAHINHIFDTIAKEMTPEDIMYPDDK